MALVAAIEQNNSSVFRAIVPKYIKRTDLKPYGRPVDPVSMVKYHKREHFLKIYEDRDEELKDLCERFEAFSDEAIRTHSHLLRSTEAAIQNLKKALQAYSATHSLDTKLEVTDHCIESLNTVRKTFEDALKPSRLGHIQASLEAMMESANNYQDMISLLKDSIEYIRIILIMNEGQK